MYVFSSGRKNPYIKKIKNQEIQSNSYITGKTVNDIKRLFEKANDLLLKKDKELFVSRLNERTLCGALMLHLHDLIKHDSTYKGYYTDVEYNRNRGKIKTAVKTIQGPDLKIIRINCDLILHSRGEHPEQDNLLAIEMKKSHRRKAEKQSDRDRLVALTKDSFDDIWSFDGETLPEHVCRYVLGVYYEIDYNKKLITIEYYHQGEMIELYMKNL